MTIFRKQGMRFLKKIFTKKIFIKKLFPNIKDINKFKISNIVNKDKYKK